MIGGLPLSANARRNPAARFRDSLAGPAAPLPAGRYLPAASASVAAPQLQAVPDVPAQHNSDLIAAGTEASLPGVQLAALALRRHPTQAYVPPVGVTIRTQRRIFRALSRSRRAISA